MHPDLAAGRYNLQLHSIIHHFCLLDKRENGVFEIFFAAAACFLGRLLAPAFSLLCCPHPPDPLPLRGRGRLKVNFAGGFAPGTPALNRLRHWLSLPRGRGPSQTPKFLSPGPPSPWLPALLIENRFLSFLRRTMGSAPECPHGRGCKCRNRSNAGVPGAKPPAKLTFNLPLPAGKGAGGMGERKQAKGRVGWRQRRQAPLRTPQRQGRQATPPLRPRRYKMFTKVRASPP